MKSDRLRRPLAHNAKVFVMVLNEEDYQPRVPSFRIESQTKKEYSTKLEPYLYILSNWE